MVFAAVLYLLLYSVFSLIELKNQIQRKEKRLTGEHPKLAEIDYL
jgi:hypothetical protein